MTFKRAVINLVLLIQLTQSFAQNLVGTNLRLRPTSLPLTCNDGDIRFDTATSRTNYCATNLWTQFAAANSTVAAATAFATNPADCAAGQFATTIAVNGDLTCTTPANTFSPALTVNDTAADTPTIQEMLLLTRTGGSNLTGTNNRAGAVTFKDANNPTYVGMVTGYRRDPNNDFQGGLRFYTNASGGQATAHTSLVLGLTLDHSSNANFVGNVTSAGFYGPLTGTASQAGTASFSTTASTAGTASFSATASRAGTAAATESISGVLAIANGGTNNGTLAVTNGGIIYGDGSKLMNAGVGTAGQVLRSNGAAAPTWSSNFITGWTQYTATLAGFGTASTTNFFWRCVGTDLEVVGKFTMTGASTASEARIGFPANKTSASTIPAIRIAGTASTDNASDTVRNALIEQSVTYFTIGGSGPLTKVLANGFANSAQTVSIRASAEINGGCN